jgi:hypothetical protein
MSIMQGLLKPLVNNGVESVKKFAKDWFNARKNADEDGDGRADWDQVCADSKIIVDSGKAQLAAFARLGALATCYHLKYSSGDKNKVMAIVSAKVAPLEKK